MFLNYWIMNQAGRRWALKQQISGGIKQRVAQSFWNSRASLIAQLVKNLPTMQETWVQSLDWKDLLEKGQATHSSILAWRAPWTVLSTGHNELDMTEWLLLSLFWNSEWIFCKKYLRLIQLLFTALCNLCLQLTESIPYYHLFWVKWKYWPFDMHYINIGT